MIGRTAARVELLLPCYLEDTFFSDGFTSCIGLLLATLVMVPR
jgi:hypothetical protein